MSRWGDGGGGSGRDHRKGKGNSEILLECLLVKCALWEASYTPSRGLWYQNLLHGKLLESSTDRFVILLWPAGDYSSAKAGKEIWGIEVQVSVWMNMCGKI